MNTCPDCKGNLRQLLYTSKDIWECVSCGIEFDADYGDDDEEGE